MRGFVFAAVGIGVVFAVVAPVGESEAAPISTAPRPPSTPPPSPFPPTGEVKCLPVPAISAYRFEDSMVDALGANEPFVAGAVAPTYVTGRAGKALSFTSGASATAKVKAPAGNKWTVAHWLKYQVPVADSGPATCRSGRDDIATAFDFYRVTVESGCGMPPYLLVMTTGHTPAPLATWTHLALSFDGSKQRVYVDGKEQNTGSTTKLPKPELTFQLGEPIGRYDANTFRGEIDDLRIYGVPLTPAQIAQLAGGTEPESADCRRR